MLELSAQGNLPSLAPMEPCAMPSNHDHDPLDVLEHAKEQYKQYLDLTRVTESALVTQARRDVAAEDPGYGYPLTITLHKRDDCE